MDAVPVLLADAIATVINASVTAEEFDTLGFTAERSYPDWDDDFRDLKRLAVDVVPVTSESGGGGAVELDSEATTNTGPTVDIAIRKRFQPSERSTPGALEGRVKQTAIDTLIRLVEQIHEKLEGGRDTPLTLAAGVEANWMETTVRTYCDYKRLREGCFLGVVRVTYDVSKAVP